MKKYIISIGMAALLLSACTIKEEQPVVATDTPLILTGYSYVQTKVSIGEKDGEVYPLLWAEGDAISIYSTDGTVSGVKANLLARSSGEATGSFATVDDVDVTAGTDLIILHPETLTYSGGVISGTIAESQTQAAANSSAHVGVNDLAYGETTINAGQTDGVSFTLDHKVAFVKVIVPKLEDYADYALSGVTLKSDGARLSGSVSYDTNSDTFTLRSASSSVGATISDPSVITDYQCVYFTAAPYDLTDASCTLTLSFTGNGANVSLPFIMTGGLLKAGCLSVIEVNPDDAAPSWYEPVDTRDFMNKYAYGPANTIFIEQPESGAGSVTFEVKARGDYFSVVEPKYYSILIESDIDGDKFLYLPDESNAPQETPTNEVDNGMITVKCYSKSESKGHWGTVAIYDEDYNLIWSFMIWKYLTGDEPADVDYGTVKLLDRAIGQPYSNKMAESLGTFDQPAIAYFQWGRKDPFPYGNPNDRILIDVRSRYDGASMSSTILKPTTDIFITAGAGNWIQTSEASEMFWGGDAIEEGSTVAFNGKTLYDPCPEGYRVCDAEIINRLMTCDNNSRNDSGAPTSYTEFWEAKNDAVRYENTSSPFYTAGQSVIAYKLSDNSYDYWPYAGFNWSGNGYSEDSPYYQSTQLINSTNAGIGYWSCNAYDNLENNEQQQAWATCYSWNGDTSGTGNNANGNWKGYTHTYKVYTMPVRCQKED